MELQCNTCKFWEMIGDTGAIETSTIETPSVGLCRRHAAPATLATVTNSLEGARSILVAQWPRTKEKDWCGEWEHQVKTQTEDR